MGLSGDRDRDREADGAEEGLAAGPGIVSGSAGSHGGGSNGGILTAGEAVLATAGYDHTIKIWNITTALCAKTFQHPDSVCKITVTDKYSVQYIVQLDFKLKAVA